MNLSRGYPRFNPGEYTAEEVLARGEADAALLVGSASTGEFGPAARARLADIPCVTLDRDETSLASQAAVAFTTATCGVHVGGTIYRMDDVPILLRPALDSPHPSDFEVLTALEQALSSRQ